MRSANTGSAPTGCSTVPAAIGLRLFDAERVNGDQVADLATKWRVPDGYAVVMLPDKLTRWKVGLDFIAAIARHSRRDLCCLLVVTEHPTGICLRGSKTRSPPLSTC